MAGSTLTTTILINATVGNGFTAVGDTLTALGVQVDQISSKLVSWGKESTEIFKDYEYSMHQAQEALAGNMGVQTKELDDAMVELDGKAREWASNTVFHTNEVGDAINKAAHAGWSYDAIIEAMPSAMRLAQAGGLDLADAVDYISTSMRALGVESGEMDHFIDIWTYAATHSVGDIETFGQTMETLGSVGRFADSNEELFTMIALMQSMGESGSTAATMLRTTWMNLLAPSQTASLVLENLGATEEEIESIRDNEALKESLSMLADLGFSPFDENGQAKPMLQTFTELRDVISGIVGGEGINSFSDLVEMTGGTAEALDMIYKNQTADGVLGVIFGKRGIRGALNTFAGLDDAMELYGDLSGGMAEGFSQYSADTMMDTLYGRVETFYSKLENLKLRVGETLSSDVSGLAAAAGEFSDAVAGMDEGKFNALVGGLEMLAGAGGALIGAGAALRLIGFAISPLGAGVLGVIALASAAKALAELEKVDFKEKFGDMTLDEGQIQSYIEKLTTDFDTAYQKVNEFNAALETAVSDYTTLTSSLKSNLITDMLIGTDVSPGSKEYANLTNIGKKIIAAVKEGIGANYEGTMEGVTTTFGEDAAENPVYSQIMSVLESGYESAIEEANGLSEELRSAMMSAFADGALTGDEISNIQAIMDQMNDLVARQAERQDFIERNKILRKAQTMGLEAIQDASELLTEKRDESLDTLIDRQLEDELQIEYDYRKMIENGTMVPNTDGTEGMHAATEDDMNAALAEIRGRHKEEQYAWGANYSTSLMDLWTQGIRDSDLAGTWTALEQLGDSFAKSGGVITPDAANQYGSAVNTRENQQIQKYLDMMVSAIGGVDDLMGYADYYESVGEAERAAQYRQILAMYEATGGEGYTAMPASGERGASTGAEDYNVSAYDEIAALLQGSGLSMEYLSTWMQEQQGMFGTYNWQDFPLFSDLTVNAQNRGMDIGQYVEGAMAEPQESTIAVDADTSAAQSAIDGLDGQTVSIGITGDTSQVDAQLAALDGRSISVTIQTNQIALPTGGGGGVNVTEKYAEGGRATEASIFGEAGAEWAIPEEHSERTAALLNAARVASGFTWDELLARNGGMNAGGGSVTLVYSPTIYAQNAEGVAEQLAEDKQRLEKWLREREMMNDLEVYQ